MKSYPISGHVTQIMDRQGVGMALVQGTASALLIDTGYGLEAILPELNRLTALPVRVVLTHAHHDHALGAMQFEAVSAFPEEKAIYATYTVRERRIKVLKAADLDPAEQETYLSRTMPELGCLEEGSIDLGGVHVQVHKVPGHTPGSAVFLVEEDRLLISGDNWNPETWLFFPEALPLQVYRQNMQKVMELPFDYVLCSHRQGRFPRSMLRAFLCGIRADAPFSPFPFPDLPAVDAVRMQLPEEQVIVFDRQKCAFDQLETNVQGRI